MTVDEYKDHESNYHDHPEDAPEPAEERRKNHRRSDDLRREQVSAEKLLDELKSAASETETIRERLDRNIERLTTLNRLEQFKGER